MLVRIGTFFIVIGLVLLVMFVGSIMGKEIHGIYLFLSFAAFVVGFLFRRNRPVSDSGRFGSIRRASERSRLRREERLNQKQKRGNSPVKRGQITQAGRENEQ
jgi:hypothetical protein